MTLKEKLNLWVKITGLDPSEEKTSFSINLSGKLSDYDIKVMDDKIKEVLQIDETGLFTEAYLGIYFKKFIKEKTVSLMDIILNTEMQELAEDCRTLYQAILETGAEEEIIRNAKSALDFYDLESDKLNAENIMDIVTSAKHCVNKGLKLDQIAKGRFDKTSFKASNEIYMYRSISDVIRYAAKGAITGVSLCYIRNEKNIDESYFAFLIRNGENLYILSDRPVYEYPIQRNFSRCPGRDMSRRIEGNWFPYSSLSGIDISDLWGGSRYGVSETDTELSNIIEEDAVRVKIGTLKSMDQCEAFWAVYMFQLIKEKFYNGKVSCPELSYCRANIICPGLEDNGRKEIVAAGNIPLIPLVAPTLDDVNELEYDGHASQHLYDYLIERYIDKVNTKIMDLVDGRDNEFMLLPENSKTNDWGTKNTPRYESINLNDLRTEEELKYDQRWLARYNIAKAIADMEEKDYERNYAFVRNAVVEMFEKNLRKTILSGFRGEIPMNKTTFDAFYNDGLWYCCTKVFHKGENNWTKADYKSYFIGKKPSVVLTFQARTAEELAKLCNVKVPELPEEFQHYNYGLYHQGNHLLGNYDPMDWAIKDHYNEKEFNFAVVLSVEETYGCQDEAGVAREAFWKSGLPRCYKRSRFINATTEKATVENAVGTCKGQSRGFDLCKKCEKCKFLLQITRSCLSTHN